MSPVEPLITPKELGVLLKVSINSARKIMRENGGIYVGAQLRWTQAKYERFLRTGGNSSTTPRPPAEPPSPPDASSNPYLKPITPRTLGKKRRA